ncbi:MAG: hypothetical protein QG657_250 [Acidobacteriota bacterium]|nr:hypothetical protein [Acidobacteriota bacterium]
MFIGDVDVRRNPFRFIPPRYSDPRLREPVSPIFVPRKFGSQGAPGISVTPSRSRFLNVAVNLG